MVVRHFEGVVVGGVSGRGVKILKHVDVGGRFAGGGVVEMAVGSGVVEVAARVDVVGGVVGDVAGVVCNADARETLRGGRVGGENVVGGWGNGERAVGLKSHELLLKDLLLLSIEVINETLLLLLIVQLQLLLLEEVVVGGLLEEGERVNRGHPMRKILVLLDTVEVASRMVVVEASLPRLEEERGGRRLCGRVEEGAVEGGLIRRGGVGCRVAGGKAAWRRNTRNCGGVVGSGVVW